ncbi:MAG TPA: dTDP-4-dehydrorhamnose 3,5-epimerase [Spirochaetota bacterium]|nr:dTDP-4-dehydrorhamnose 3,5-epimerase [Spirochaetota bacterium]HPC41961.1 dTDP-4-dehydrorhamnose 3,5-epimerase [Spirochaetota bacterium]HPL19101.1 dTDP-4-dehydrorhamnose 3,5-epimerase [Spirochaetota bacterium]HQF06993.1 dTDP-4-dehydrorhamnose 3,5-epimerase [Spirochaetota bacterium]HQH95730.1 dTDP-4-dehydrorhamnose 3,5-epimerase [Spirochaetota bacterium]
MPFTFTNLEINGLVMVEPRVFPDDRGFFLESYKESDFARAGIPFRFVQDNHSRSIRNVIRGLHFQRPPRAQGKLVRVIRGKVWDVAVDIRKGSPTYRRWVGVELSEENKLMIFIPPGFAHGFVALTDDVHIMYKCTEEYDAALDGGIRWDDPDIGVAWPVKDPVVSDKDRVLPYLRELADL